MKTLSTLVPYARSPFADLPYFLNSRVLRALRSRLAGVNECLNVAERSLAIADTVATIEKSQAVVDSSKVPKMFRLFI